MAARPDMARKLLIYWMDAVMAGMAVVFAALTIAETTAGTISVARGASVLMCLLGFFGLYPFLLRQAFDHRPGPTPKLALAAVFALGMLLLMPHNGDMAGLRWESVTLWLSAAALYLPLWATVCLGTASVAMSTVFLAHTTGQAWPGILLSETAVAVVLIAAMLLWRWLWWMIRDAHKSREAKASLAVAEERLRFARDLHDLLGHSLAVITLKSELAAKLATKDAARASAEMAAVRELAGESLAEVQQAVHGYQRLDLEEELDGVRVALEATGARCEIRARADGLGPEARTLLAWAVREGGTNVLKHSRATRCAITIDGGVLEMVNDGVNGLPGTPGNGLRGLSERLVAAGGSFSAAPTRSGEFLLRAAVPS
ncbi:sensor histidine kinase [Nonomuraea sp. KC401]|uniref:sensor histidine kinase n=1 Tax=unclassified Nonomuraea TaxID=2593643 RepID=UPI0010FEDC1D|nr:MULTISPECIES: histidine kinase [unclassified Nonomuraea]NBE93696.1 sensor histidine kinase [Nonomuraea sp. K271]TLF76962.1 sensor histidine kinase [Nonomuraea sp. KC401]